MHKGTGSITLVTLQKQRPTVPEKVWTNLHFCPWIQTCNEPFLIVIVVLLEFLLLCWWQYFVINNMIVVKLSGLNCQKRNHLSSPSCVKCIDIILKPLQYPNRILVQCCQMVPIYTTNSNNTIAMLFCLSRVFDWRWHLYPEIIIIILCLFIYSVKVEIWKINVSFSLVTPLAISFKTQTLKSVKVTPSS